MSQKKASYRDEVFYAGSDSGCHMATTFLEYQSCCLECPFDKCVYEMTPEERNKLLASIPRPLPKTRTPVL